MAKRKASSPKPSLAEMCHTRQGLLARNARLSEAIHPDTWTHRVRKLAEEILHRAAPKYAHQEATVREQKKHAQKAIVALDEMLGAVAQGDAAAAATMGFAVGTAIARTGVTPPLAHEQKRRDEITAARIDRKKEIVALYRKLRKEYPRPNKKTPLVTRLVKAVKADGRKLSEKTAWTYLKGLD